MWVRPTLIALLLSGAVLLGIPVGCIYLVRSASNTFETLATVRNLDGLDFEVEYGSFDGIGKDEWVNVYAWKAGSRDSAFSRLFHPRKRIFNYDPWTWHAAPPEIKAMGAHSVLISLPRASSVSVEVRQFGDVAFDYRVDQVEYPMQVRTN